MASPATSPLGNLAQSEERWRGYVERIRAKDAGSLARLYDETSGILYGLALRILNDPKDAEEVVVAVYQQVWTTANLLETGAVLRSLIMLTRSRAIERIRSGNRAASVTSVPEQFGIRVINGPESLYRRERDLAQRALAELAPEQREAVELAFFSGLPETELAQILGAPVGTIRHRIRAGVCKLREELRLVESTADGRQKAYRGN